MEDDRKGEVTVDELTMRFEQVSATLRDLDLNRIWEAATPQERRVLVEELIEEVAILPDHLEVTVAGAPKINVLFEEVGLKQSETAGVGGPTCNLTPRLCTCQAETLDRPLFDQHSHAELCASARPPTPYRR
jgi:hypothetical protein